MPHVDAAEHQQGEDHEADGRAAGQIAAADRWARKACVFQLEDFDLLGLQRLARRHQRLARLEFDPDRHDLATASLLGALRRVFVQFERGGQSRPKPGEDAVGDFLVLQVALAGCGARRSPSPMSTSATSTTSSGSACPAGWTRISFPSPG